MNKYLVSFIALFVLPISAFAANDWSNVNRRTSYSNQYSRQSYGSKQRSEHVGSYYMGLRGDLSFLSWENKYSGVKSGNENFSFKPVLGLDVSAGYRFDEDWRVDGEFGYMGKFSETETEKYLGFPLEKTEFSLETYYIDANAYYDIANGFYAGLGAGLAIVNLEAKSNVVADASVTNVSPMGAAMLGWVYSLDEKIDLDIRYRLALFSGGKLTIGGVGVDTGLVMNNSLSAGIRYHF